MQLNYIYRKSDDFYVGHLVDFPEYDTQGKTLDELEEMLRSLYADLMAFDDIHSKQDSLTEIYARETMAVYG